MKNTTLMLMRHGKSDWHAGAGSDFDRPLTKRGVNDAHRIGRWMVEQEWIPDRIVSSPARRALDTARLVSHELDQDPDSILLDERIYEATRERLLEVIAKHSPGSRCLLLVGHNPGLDSLVEWLAGTEPARAASGKLMTTAAVAVFGRDDAAAKPAAHTLPLRQIVRPKDLG